MKIDITKLNVCVASSCMSLLELSKESGVDVVTINRILLGKQNPRRSTIGHIAKALKIDVAEIIETEK